jgi:uncharacterized membrane protein
VLEALLSFLLKLPSHAWARGDLVFAPTLGWPGLAVLTAGALGSAWWAYGGRPSVPRRTRVALAVLRSVTILVVALCLARPGLAVSTAVPQRNVLAILLDDSRSMRLADDGAIPRLAQVQATFGDSARLVRALGARFALRFFRFGADARPLRGAAALTGAGTRTDLAAALAGARDELAGMPVAGMVVVTDGADNAGGDLDGALLALKARRVPVHAVGVGVERFARDIAIERAQLPSSVLAGGTVLADVALRLRGVGGARVPVTVEADGRLVAADTVTLPDRGDVARVRLRVPTPTAGTYRVTVRARALPGETVTENNELHTVLRVRPGPERLLYFEGEPRPELAFLRRAVAPDSAIELVTLLRSAEGKFLRLGVRDSLELIAGFPTARDELFRFRGVVLGSVEATFFTGDQLRMLADFVGERGGGLLALGGRAALGEGGYGGTPLGDVLPVILENGAGAADAPATELRVRPTGAGLAHAALQLAAGDSANARRWDSLPPLTTVNRAPRLRAGATTLLAGRRADGAETPVLATHRFGRGLAAVLTAQDTWLWQMHAAIAVDDPTHETLWRQTLRWLVEDAPDRIEVAATPSRVGPGEPVAVRVRVADSAFRAVNDAAVTAVVTTPSGREVAVPLEWNVREDGAYEGRMVAEEPGVYALAARVVRGRDTTLAGRGALLADDQGADVEQAELRAPLLRRVAGETGGRYYPLADAPRLADDVVYTESGVTVRDTTDLWDAPLVFLALLLLLGAEWAWRRRAGLR